MTEFLASQLPKVYETNVNESFSKVAFTSRLCKALTTVGMVPLTSTWPFDIFQFTEFPVSDGVYLFPFDYPDTGTFRVGAQLYRPCVVVAMYIGDTSGTSNPTRLQNHVLIDEALRLDGAVSIATIHNKSYDRGVTTGQGFGTLTTDYTNQFPNSAGQEVQKANWLTYSGAGGTDQSVLSTGHWFIYLGPGGLFVFVGTGNARANFGDLLAYGIISLGARIPGRELPILEDSNLNRINPMVYFPLRESGASSEVWNTGAGEFAGILRTKIHGMHFNLKQALEPVDAYLLNLENVEYPIFPSYAPDTRPSPREITGGQGAHILGRPVLVPDALESDENNLFGPVVPTLASNEVRPGYEQVFSGDGFRFCDVVAPLGIFEDPFTNLDWYLVPTYNTGQTIGLLIEPNTPSTVVDALDFGSLTSLGFATYDLTGAGGWTGGTFATPTTITPNVGQSWWSDADVGNKQTFVVPSSTSTQTSDVEWSIEVDSGDTPDTLYEIQFDAFNRDDPQAGAGDPEGLNALQFDYNFNGNWVTALLIECAGDNPAYVNSEGELSYTLTTYTAPIPKETSQITPRFLVRWRVTRNGGSRANNGEVGSIRINKYRYI